MAGFCIALCLLCIVLCASKVDARDNLPSVITLKSDVYWFQNTPTAFYEGDTIDIFSFKYAYISLFVDDRKYRPRPKADSETEEQIRLLMQAKQKEEVFVNSYAVPNLTAGEHTLRLALAQTKNKDGSAYPIAIIRARIRCTPIPLIFFPGETCACALERKSIRFIQRPGWLARKLEDEKNAKD